jgi:hypothetical protein
MPFKIAFGDRQKIKDYSKKEKYTDNRNKVEHFAWKPGVNSLRAFSE